jgi:outer membrane lipopolysaccharide assembly protein LptE/RlpB
MVLTTAGCGFHLRGQNNLQWNKQNTLPKALHTLYLSTNEDNLFTHQLEQTLIAMGAQIVKQPVNAQTILELHPEKIQQQLVSTNAQNQIYQYLISYQVDFQLKNHYGVPFGPRQSIIITRTISFNANQILSDANSQLELQQAMRQDAIAQLISRLSFTLSQ